MTDMKAFGVLVIHGITANPETVREMEAPMKSLGLPVHIPVLRGHGADSPEKLRGVTWHEWISDAESALKDLLTEAEKAIIIGHSMGGLIAILLAAEHGSLIDSIILAGAAVQPASPLAPGKPLSFLAPVVGKLFKKWNFPPLYADPECARDHPNYLWAPMESVLTLLDLTRTARRRLADVLMPVLILQSRKDTRVAPESAEIIFSEVSTPEQNKRIVWFEKTDHEMFLDCERKLVAEVITKYVQERIGSG